jgi:ABC-type oligopeptide transport system ATPase subunit
VQAQVIALMRELQETLGLAYLFIAHDLAVVERISHRVAVMKAGRIVESGPTSEVLTRPRHAYTRELLAAVPIPDPSTRRRPLHDAGPRPAALPPQHA